MRTESVYGWLVSESPEDRARLSSELEATYRELGPAPGLPAGPDDFAALETEILVGRYLSNPQPAFSRLPFDYRLIPSPIRSAGLTLLDRLHAGDTAAAFPGWPDESRLDDLRARIWAGAAKRTNVGLSTPAYPKGCRGTVLLTHDIDSRADIDRIAPLRQLERQLGLVSSIGFIPEISWPDRAVIAALVEDGCEVYCHDIRHNGKLPYSSQASMRASFDRFFERNGDARDLLRGFRSGQLLMTAQLLGVVGEFFEYDLSLPDTERGGPYGSTAGCASVYPFLVDDLLEIPLTMPQDFFLANVERLDSDGMLSVWRDKLEAVLARGGVAVLNTHPIWANPARASVWSAYGRLLETIAAANAWVATPSSLREWLFGRRKSAAG
jgi:hypothetical protein